MAKRGVCGKAGMHGRGYAWWGEACVAKGGMHGRGVCGIGGLCVAGKMATAADGTHPTGMHSCWLWDDI